MEQNRSSTDTQLTMRPEFARIDETRNFGKHGHQQIAGRQLDGAELSTAQALWTGNTRFYHAEPTPKPKTVQPAYYDYAKKTHDRVSVMAARSLGEMGLPRSTSKPSSTVSGPENIANDVFAFAAALNTNPYAQNAPFQHTQSVAHPFLATAATPQVEWNALIAKHLQHLSDQNTTTYHPFYLKVSCEKLNPAAHGSLAYTWILVYAYKQPAGAQDFMTGTFYYRVGVDLAWHAIDAARLFEIANLGQTRYTTHYGTNLFTPRFHAVFVEPDELNNARVVEQEGKAAQKAASGMVKKVLSFGLGGRGGCSA